MDEKKICCPTCGKEMGYSLEDNSLKCVFCGTKLQIIDSNNMMNKDIICCSNCNKEFINLKDEKCPYCNCDNLKKEKKNNKKIEGYIEFKIDEAQAISIVKKDIGNKKDLIDCTKLFIPYWVFSSNVSCIYRGTMLNTNDSSVAPNVSFNPHSNHINEHFDNIYLKAFDDGGYIQLFGYKLDNVKKFNDKVLRKHNILNITFDSDDATLLFKDYIKEKLKEIIKESNRTYQTNLLSIKLKDLNFFDLSCKLVLIPIYRITYKDKDKTQKIIINGESGNILANTKIKSSNKYILYMIIFIILFLILINIDWF